PHRVRVRVGTVMRGLTRASRLRWRGSASLSGVAGTSPAMTSGRRADIGIAFSPRVATLVDNQRRRGRCTRVSARRKTMGEDHMVARLWLACCLVAAPLTTANPQPADKVLQNGKIVTVDDRFAIVEALAIRGQRIVATGSAADMDRLKGPSTETIDLRGRTVIPGLIDNHAHWIRAAEHNELRFDGVTSRQEALKLLATR